ncbi:MAG: FtsW/RodA/SpoVE family cell cycle protein [Cryomorphaceae bacterium]|nr:FtsW/RodA/SpoVE family cell cycle protein [Cryomorphaceae bacterium]
MKLSFDGDPGIWALLALLVIASFLSVYSASANLAFVYGKVSVTYWLKKHLGHLFVGAVLLFIVHKIPYKFFGSLSVLGIILSIIGLFFTLFMGTEIDGANANRWLLLPGVKVKIQTSAFAGLALLIYLARCLSKKHAHEWNLKNSWIIYVPMGLVLGMIFPANFSTAALLFFSSMMVLFVGKYPLKYIGAMLGGGLVMVLLFVATVSIMPNMSHRIDTWKSRIESFFSGESSENYQVEKAKMAISSGGVFGQGPGKSVQKNFLPQSTSDFIYAIIVEEYGMVGGILTIFLYLLLWVRIIRISLRTPSYFGSLTAFAAGFAMIFQAFVNMSVAVNLFPVTGQTLPLLSAGGSSIYVSCIAMGIIQSISRNNRINEPDEAQEENPNAEMQPVT